MDKGPHTDLHLNSWIWLSRTRDAVFSARRKELHRYAISARQASVMFVIQALGDKATPGEISRWLLREPNSVSEFLKRMEKDGLIKRSPDPRRRNVVRVKLTEKGIKAHQKTTKLESIRNQRTRWGSCSHKNNISLNMKLVRLPDDLVDYVIIHELVHTRKKNHGKGFWAMLDKCVGNGKDFASRLRKYGVGLP